MLYTFFFKLHKLGRYTEIDDVRAQEMLKESADQEHDMALMELGRMHFFAREYEQALPYLHKAVEAGNTEANMVLSDMYRKGLGVKVDEKASAEYCLTAAKLGDPNAQYNIGAMYMNGNGVDRNNNRGVEWLTKSSNSFLESAIKLYDAGLLDSAREHAVASLQIFMDLGPSYRGIIRITSLLGAIYGDMKEVPEAKKYYEMALHAADRMEEKDDALIASLKNSFNEMLMKNNVKD